MKIVSQIVLLVFAFSFAQFTWAYSYKESQNELIDKTEQDCPEQPGLIKANSQLFYNGSVIEYSVNPVDGASHYVWTLPKGWKGSSTGNSITVITNGEKGSISVRAANGNCLSEPSTLKLRSSAAPDVPICLVTVDSTSTFNKVVWEKPATATIDSFLVYRMFSDSNYYKVGAVHYDSLSLFNDMDTAANPNTSAHRYKLATRDTAGVISTLSDYHATMHLSVSAIGEMLWTWYKIENDTNPVDSFFCYRDDLGNGNPQSINVLAGNVQDWIDADFALYPNAKYVVDVDWTISCTATRENVNTTRSNLAVRDLPTGLSPSVIDEIAIYPNPSDGPIFLNIPAKVQATGYVLWSGLGAISYNETLPLSNNDHNISIDIPSLAPGIYLLEIQTQSGSLTKKVLVR